MKKINIFTVIMLLFMVVPTVKSATIEENLETLSSEITNIKAQMFLDSYPVGSIYITTASDESTITQMASKYGGTWAVYGAGRVIIGYGSNGTTNYSTINGTGGNTTISYTPGGTVGNTKLTINQIPSHYHGLNNHTHGIPAHTHGFAYSGTSYAVALAGTSVDYDVFDGVFADTGYKIFYTTTSVTISRITATTSSGGTTGAAAGNTAANGGSAAHNHTFTGTAKSINVIQPYIVAYMYKRTA